MKNWFVLLFLVFSKSAFAQNPAEDVVYEYKKGKKFTVHIAQQGNTLWGLHTTYGVPVNDIIATNPGIDKGVVEGNKYLIPAGNADGKFADGAQVLWHVVVKGDTPFNLAKKHGVTLDEITKLNPETTTGLKLGQIVKIPLIANQDKPVTTTVEPPKVVEPTVTFSDSLITYVVKDNETLYSIAKRFMVPVTDLQKLNNLKSNKIKEGDALNIPLKKESIKPIEVRPVKPIKPSEKVDEELLFKPKEKYSIAILLPFGLNENGNSALKTLATEFYMGAQVAIDSLEKLGLEARIEIIDLPTDSVGIMAILKKPEMKKLDLVIGPLLPQNADVVGNWCKINQIRMVCPAAINSSLLQGNQYVYAAVSSDITQQRILAKYTLDNFSASQIVLVNTGVSKDKELYDAYRNRFLELSAKKGNVKLIEIKVADVATYIRKNGNTLFVVPTRDKVASVKFMNTLHKVNGKAGTGTITVFGTKEWANFEEISGYYRTKYAIHWAASSDLNYSLPETKTVLRLYRIKYKADMNRIGAQGFDVTYCFIRSLLMDKEGDSGIQNAFRMEKVAPGSGYESNQCFIVKHEDFELIRVALVHE